MDDYSYVRLDIPAPEDFAPGASPIPEPHNVVYATIDVLLGCLAQWRGEAYSQPDEEAWAALMAAASQALAGLVAAYGTDRAAESVRRRKEQMESWRRSEEAHTGACETASGPLTDHVDGEAR